jgi:flagellar biosynthetic protein FliR
MFPLFPFLNVNEISFFALVLARLAGIFSAIPLFGGERAPRMIRVALVLVMTLVCYPVLKTKIPQLPADTPSLVILIIRETLIGISLGLLSRIIFSAVEFCGQLVGMQMGFSMSSMFDPSMGQVPLLATFQMLLAMLLFLTLEIHHVFIRAIVESYQVMPPGTWHMSGGLLKFIVMLTTGMFVLGVKLAAPVMVALLAVSVVLGIMARSFPQMNIFMVSMPLNIGIGLLVLGLSLLIFMHTLQVSFGDIDTQINTLFKILSRA